MSGNVLIVGGGIGGVMLAYFLLERGVTDITLVEQGEIGNGATGHSAGMLLTEIEGESLETLSKKIGFMNASKYWHAQGNMLQKIAHIIKQENIQCDAVTERLFVFSKRDTKEMKTDSELRHKMHLVSKNYVGEKILSQIQTEYYDTAEEILSGLSVNPLQLVQGLAEVLVKRGVQIYEHSQVTNTGNKISVGTHALNFNTVVYAQDAYSNSSDILKYKTTCVVSEVVPKHILSMMHLRDYKMYIENQVSSYHYMKMTKDGRLLVGFGDRKTNTIGEVTLMEEHVQNIKKYLSVVFPHFKIGLAYAWTGVYGLHVHPLPCIQSSGQVHFFGGAGTQVATVVSAEIVADRVVGKKHVLDHLF